MKTPFLKELKNGIVHLLYPQLCAGCSKPLMDGEQVLCISCNIEIPETHCHHIADNETAMRFAGRIPFVHATSYAWFTNGGLLQHLVHELKYRNRKCIGIYLGILFGRALQGTDWIKDIDVLVP